MGELNEFLGLASDKNRLDLMRGGEKVQEYLEELTGHSEMPNIFVQGKVRAKGGMEVREMVS